jgi:hypothetical protein
MGNHPTARHVSKALSNGEVLMSSTFIQHPSSPVHWHIDTKNVEGVTQPKCAPYCKKRAMRPIAAGPQKRKTANDHYGTNSPNGLFHYMTEIASGKHGIPRVYFSDHNQWKDPV